MKVLLFVSSLYTISFSVTSVFYVAVTKEITHNFLFRFSEYGVPYLAQKNK